MRVSTGSGYVRSLAFVAALAALQPLTARAQVATVSAKPLEGWVADFKEICRIAFPAELARPIIDGLDKVSGPDGLAGLDFKRSFGAVADLPQGGETPLAVVVLPVTDGKVFLESLKKLGLGVDEQLNSKTYTHTVTLPDGVTKLYAYPADKHLYLGMFPYTLARLKSVDPAELERSRPKSSELTVSVRLDRLPRPMVDGFLAQFEASLAAKDAREPGEIEATYLGRKFAQDLGKKWIKGIVNDGKELAVDLDLDPKAGPMGLEVRFTAKAGSPSAGVYNEFGKRVSVFGGLGAGSVMDAYGVIPVPAEVRSFVTKLSELSRKDAEEKLKDAPEKERKAAKALVDVLEKVIASETWDGAAAMKGPFNDGGPDSHVVVLGIKVPDGAGIEARLRSLPDAPWKLDVAKSKDGKVSIHKLVPPPGQPQPTIKAMGKLDAYFAITSDAALVAIGGESLSVLQSALADIRKPAAPGRSQIEARVALGKVMNFADTEQERKTFGALSKSIFTGPDAGKDGLVASISGGGDALRIKVSGDVVLLKFLMQVGFAVQGAPKP